MAFPVKPEWALHPDQRLYAGFFRVLIRRLAGEMAHTGKCRAFYLAALHAALVGQELVSDADRRNAVGVAQELERIGTAVRLGRGIDSHFECACGHGSRPCKEHAVRMAL